MAEIVSRFTDVPSVVELAIIAFAAWRLSWFLIRDNGPFNICLKLRESAGIDHDPDGNQMPLTEHATMFAKLFSCPWCLTFWTGLYSFAIFALFPPLSLVFAIWAIASMLEAIALRLIRL